MKWHHAYYVIHMYNNRLLKPTTPFSLMWIRILFPSPALHLACVFVHILINTGCEVSIKETVLLVSPKRWWADVIAEYRRGLMWAWSRTKQGNVCKRSTARHVGRVDMFSCAVHKQMLLLLTPRRHQLIRFNIPLLTKFRYCHFSCQNVRNNVSSNKHNQ